MARAVSRWCRLLSIATREAVARARSEQSATHVRVRSPSLQPLCCCADLLVRRCLRGAAWIAGVLKLHHPARVFGRQRARGIERGELLCAEHEFGGGQIVFELREAFGADDDAGDEGFAELPGERYACDRGARLFRHLAQRAEHAGQALHVDGREVEGGATRVSWALLVWIELAGQQTAGEWTP